MLNIFSHVPWVLQAISREIMGFRFTYPITVNADAGSNKSLSYYIHSEHLFLEHLSTDSDGIAVASYRAQGRQYNPVFIAWWALVHLNRYAVGGNQSALLHFNRQVEWFLSHAVERPDGSVVWFYGFDWQEGRCFLKAPWISAMSQGLAISVLVRAHHLRPNNVYLALCERAAKVFALPIEAGGVKTKENGYCLFEEYPAYPLPRVLDGFMFSLLGLYDLAMASDGGDARALFDEGVHGLSSHLQYWNYADQWSWYGSHGYICPPHYHTLNRLLLTVLGGLSGEERLVKMAEQWDPSNLTIREKVNIFCTFCVTKNWARVILPRN